MIVADQQAWRASVDANTDPYGRGVITYAERWADAMETAMANGETLEQCADRTSHEADTQGITGFMYGAAVATPHGPTVGPMGSRCAAGTTWPPSSATRVSGPTPRVAFSTPRSST